MAKALKPLVVILLVLSIASLVLGIMLFTKREILKGRAQRLEQATAAFARSIHRDDFDVTQLAAVDKQGLESMQVPLNRLAAAGANQYEELQQTKQDLATTREDLAQTKDELATTKTSLEQAQSDIAQLNEKVTQKDAEIAQGQEQIGKLEQDKAGMQTQIDDLNDELAKAEDTAHDLQDKIITLEQTIKDLENEYGLATKPIVPKGLTGKILVVNRDWNFVVLDIGADKGLGPNAEMLVHRDDHLIGKVTISGVTRALAIAEINRDWQQTPIKEGDYVVY